MQKKITFVIPTRNDDYYDNFASIINFTINYSLAKIYQLKLQNIFEFLLVDWSSEKRLSNEIYIPKKYRNSIKIVFVDKKAINKNHRDIFNVGEAQNFGLNLTKTQYCYLAHADQIYPKSFFLNLTHFVKNQYLSKKKTENSILYIPRKFIDENFFSHFISENTIDEYFENISFVNQKWKNDQFFLGGGHSGWFGTKKILQKFGGLKENLILENKKEIVASDAEFYQRYSQHHNFYDSSNFGIFAYRYPYVFSEKRNKSLLKRMPPIKIDKPIKRKIKKRKYQIDKFNNKLTNKYYKLPKFTLEKKKFFTIKKYIYCIKTEILDKLNEDQKVNFIVREFLVDLIYSSKIIAYMEYGYSGSSIISVIGNIFKGIDILAADFTYKFQKQKVYKRLFKLAHYFHSSKNINRYGKTKLLSFDKIEQSKFIFSYLPKEKLKSIIFINPLKIKFDLFKKLIIQNKNFIYCLIINCENQKFNFLNEFFIKKSLSENTYVFLNKSILKDEKNKVFNIINNHKENYNLKFYFYKFLKLFFQK